MRDHRKRNRKGTAQESQTAPALAPQSFNVMLKATGPICNLNCDYCYYLSKKQLYPRGEHFRMQDELLEATIQQYIESQIGPDVTFVWQGGEPTLLGLPFFRRAVALQKRVALPEKRVYNAIQTNATLINDEWASFFKEEHFLVGVSFDGPPELHDTYRKDKKGRPTAERALRGLRTLQRYGVDVNILTVVNRTNGQHPLEVYHYLRDELGADYLQFIPLVEPSGATAVPYEAALAGAGVSDRSVLPLQFGRFLTSIFDEWIRKDLGSVFVQTFEETVAVAAGRGASLCVFQEKCGRNLVMEHNGDVFSCDHFVTPEFLLGNVHDTPLSTLAGLPAQRDFAMAKRRTLPDFCKACPVLEYCRGECPKNRLIRSPEGELGLNYLCAGYRSYFEHAKPLATEIARAILDARPVSNLDRTSPGR